MKDEILAAMRQMAWERAKAELRSMSCAKYYTDEDEHKRSMKFIELVKEFIETVEYEGLNE